MCMIQLISTLILTFSLSPIWPLGVNPLPSDPLLIVNKTTNEVAFINENEVQIITNAGTGRTEDLTPEGLFTITVKAENPYYRKKNIEGGSAQNPLGTRWMGFDAKGTDGRIYGLHGTNKPHSIGHYVSEGCIRLQNETIESLYPQIPLGTKILIQSTSKSFEELAIEYGAIK
jgi:lipoprotein-anchoring transpeptidase ErfK/SrfK